MRPFAAPIFYMLVTLTACASHTYHKDPEVRPLTMPQVSTVGDPFLVAVFHGCYDGDTCTVSLPQNVSALFGDHITVRLPGIDTLEVRRVLTFGPGNDNNSVAFMSSSFANPF